MNMMANSALSEHIAAIRQRFLGQLPDRLATLEQYLEKIENREHVRDALQNIALDAHKIRGLAPTLGFDELGDRAAITEERLAQQLALGADAPIGQAPIHAINFLLDEILSVLVQTETV